MVALAVRRPWLLLRGARVDRDRPDLDRLARIDDPMAFVWAILPHAARTFSTSILMLPAAHAPTAAVAYLYCRMLDTYEDVADPDERQRALAAFAARMSTLAAPPPLPATQARDDRDRVHLLLVERCELVDRAYRSLPDADRRRITDLVAAMAEGMAASSRRFADQGGVLVDSGQLSRYCHAVMGEPILFTLLQVGGSELTSEQRRDAFAAGELIQLANITRDVERDLSRGIAYHPSLRPHLGSTDAAEPVREARRRLMAQAVPHAPAYNRLAEHFGTRRFSLARASAVVMLLSTDRHYRWCARAVGHPGWRGPDRMGTILVSALMAAFSHRWSRRVMRRVEGDFLAAAATL